MRMMTRVLRLLEEKDVPIQQLGSRPPGVLPAA
jgi:hypothetical protein